MKVNLSKREIIDMIKGTPVSYGRYAKELDDAGEWSYNMDGPTQFHWHESYLLTKSEEYLYDFYQKLYRGEFYLPSEDKECVMTPVELPILRRQFPSLAMG